MRPAGGVDSGAHDERPARDVRQPIEGRQHELVTNNPLLVRRRHDRARVVLGGGPLRRIDQGTGPAGARRLVGPSDVLGR
jgi:hypothetical protein